jgi:hypothetical protein
MKGKQMLARKSTLFALIVLSLLASPALAQTAIYVPNHSFEAPYYNMVSPYAGSNIDTWLKSPAPGWWTGAGYTDEQWANSAGIFVNVPFAPVDNCDGRQLGFMFDTPGLELYQTLSTTYQVGQSYQLTVGIEGGGYGMPVGTPMAIELYYPDADGNRSPVGTETVTNTNPPNNPLGLSHLTDWTLTIPAVAATDAWAGQDIGIDFVQTAGSGGYWDIDNVRLTATASPEPGSPALLAAGLGIFVAQRWRASKK